MGDDIMTGENRPGEASGQPGGSTTPARQVIAAFGGIRPMAGKLDVPVSTVQGWKERGVIPESRHGEIRAAAAAHAIALDDAVLAASAEGPAEAPAAPSAPSAVAAKKSSPETASSKTAGNETAAAKTAAAKTAVDGGTAQGDAAATDDAARDEDPPAPAPPIAAAAHAGARHAGARHGGRPGWVGGFVLGALVFAVGAGAAVLTKDVWGPGGAPAAGGDALADKLAGLESRVSEVETKAAAPAVPKDLATAADVTRLESQIAALTTASATDDLAAVVKELKAQVTAMGASASAGAEAATALGGLSGEVASLKSGQAELRAAIDELKADKSSQDALLWSAVGALRDALRYAGPFDQQLADVSHLAGDRAEFQEALAALKPLADAGVPSLADLQRSFPTTARNVVAAGYGASEDGVLGDVLNRVSQVVTVRPVGEVEGDSPGAIVARAEGHVDQGDLAAAIEELKALPEDAGAAAAGWRQQAEQRLAADAAITKLNGLLAGQLAAGG